MKDLTGKTFVMTGRMKFFKCREDLANLIRDAGGTVANRVTRSITALITNTPDSGTKKNRDAATFGVPVMTEAAFCQGAGIWD